MHPIWPALGILVAAPFIARGYWRRGHERRKLTGLARSKGLTFSPVDMIGLHERYYNLELIRQGHNRHAWNIVYGSTDVGLVTLFRYSYDVGFGTDQASRHCWITVLERSKAMREKAEEVCDAVVELATREADLAHPGPFDDPATRAVLLDFSRDWQVESRGNLLAICAPWDESTIVPEHLLNSIDQLGRTLAAKSE